MVDSMAMPVPSMQFSIHLNYLLARSLCLLVCDAPHGAILFLSEFKDLLGEFVCLNWGFSVYGQAANNTLM